MARSRIHIPSNGALDDRAAFASLVSHGVAGVHHLDAAQQTFTRYVAGADSAFLITLQLGPDGVTLRSPTRDAGVNSEIAARVRHWFDLDADLPTINAHLARDPLFTAQVALRPGLRITRFHSPFEAVVLTVIGQQVTLAAGRLFAGRLVAAYGESAPENNWGLKRFPRPASLAARPVEELRSAMGLTRRRAQTVRDVAALFADLNNPQDLPAENELREISGIGPWTTNYLAVRVGTEPDAFPHGDAVLRRALASIPESEQRARISSWSPYRSYAAIRLWAGL